jgi:NAD(P)-dependent dehydrogenase (short-subunit alcohol dehydrogenase family)
LRLTVRHCDRSAERFQLLAASLAGIVRRLAANARAVRSTIRRMSFQQQVAVVTGGGRGIGRAIARTLAAAGASVAVFARTDAEIRETVSIIRGADGIADGWTVDVTDARATEEAIERVNTQWGEIDLLVNNAAIGGPIGPCWESSPDEWWRTLDVNVRGPLVCTHAVVGRMIARRRGRIINVVSAALPIPYFSGYMSSKSALIRFTECLAIEAKPFSVSAFAMSPGTVRTAMSERSLNSPEGRRWLPWFRRMFDEGLDAPVERPAGLVLSLASGKYDELSGLTISPLDDLEAMRAALTTIDREKLYTMRIRTLPTSGQTAIEAVRQVGEQPCGSGNPPSPLPHI